MLISDCLYDLSSASSRHIQDMNKLYSLKHRKCVLFRGRRIMRLEGEVELRKLQIERLRNEYEELRKA